MVQRIAIYLKEDEAYFTRQFGFLFDSQRFTFEMKYYIDGPTQMKFLLTKLTCTEGGDSISESLDFNVWVNCCINNFLTVQSKFRQLVFLASYRRKEFLSLKTGEDVVGSSFLEPKDGNNFVVERTYAYT